MVLHTVNSAFSHLLRRTTFVDTKKYFRIHLHLFNSSVGVGFFDSTAEKDLFDSLAEIHVFELVAGSILFEDNSLVGLMLLTDDGLAADAVVLEERRL